MDRALAAISVLGKNVGSVVGLDPSGAVVMSQDETRDSNRAGGEAAPCVVGMETCCGAHHLGRMFAAHGHDVRLMSPEYVRPDVKAHKNDDREAEGIAEAATRPTMGFEGRTMMQSAHQRRRSDGRAHSKPRREGHSRTSGSRSASGRRPQAEHRRDARASARRSPRLRPRLRASPPMPTATPKHLSASEIRSRRYASFHAGPSATADIDGALFHGAQGVRSLSVLPLATALSQCSH